MNNQQPSLEEKLSNKNIPLEDFLKDDEAISTIKFMGKNTQKYLNPEKIKKLIKLITEEPEKDDQLTGHKFPYVAYEILRSDSPFISKRFVLNEQEYHAEYPDLPEEENGDWGLDLDEENENDMKKIDFDFKKKKVEFEKIYAQIEENFRNLKKSINMDKQERRSKDDDYKDEYKYNNDEYENNFEEGYEELEDNKEDKEDNVININNNGLDEENNRNKKQNEKNNLNKEEDENNETVEQKNNEMIENQKNNEIKGDENNILVDKTDNNENNEKKLENENVEKKMDKNETINEQEKNENVGIKNINENSKPENNEINIINQNEEKQEKVDIQENKKEELKENNLENRENDFEKKEVKELKEEIKENFSDEKKTEINKEENKKEIKEEKKEDINEVIKNDLKEEIKNEEIKEEQIEEIKEGENVEIKNDNNDKIKEELSGKIKEEQNNESQNINEIKEQNDNKNNSDSSIKDEIKDKEQNQQNENQENIAETESKQEEKNENEKNMEEKGESIDNEKEKEEGSKGIQEEEKEEKKGKEEYEGKEDKEEKEEKEEKEQKEGKEEKEEKDEKEEKGENEENQYIYANIENEIKINSEDTFKEKEDESQKAEINNQKEKDLEINTQEEEQNEETNNIIIDKAEEERERHKNIFKKVREVVYMDDEDEKSLSVEGELEEENQKMNNKKKKEYKNNPNNEYLDLLLNFVMNDKKELNYVLSGYFVNVLISLLNNYTYKILKYLYQQRRDALKKIIFHSNQKAFSILSVKLLNLESYIKNMATSKEPFSEFIEQNIPYRNELIKELINSINLDGMDHRMGIDIEAAFSLISDLINDNLLIAKELIFNDYLCPHLFDILDTDLYANIDDDINNGNFNENVFNTKYNVYCLFVNLTSKLLKVINTYYYNFIPMDFDFNSLSKNKTDLHFNDNMIISFGKLLKNNFLPKKPVLSFGKSSCVKYEGLGALNIHILDLVKDMFFFMKALPKQLDSILIRNFFCKRSVEFFFKYQWNDMYRNKFIDLFNLYLQNEGLHSELTQIYFGQLKLQNLLINFVEEKNNENENNIIQKIKFEFKSGKKIRSGIYAHVIDLMYKIQAYIDTEIFTEEEQKQFGIINLGEFQFSKDEKSNKFIKQINISNNIKDILSKDEKWNSTFKNKVLPILRKYEGQLCKRPKIADDDDLDIKNDFGSNNLLLQQMLNVIKKTGPPKRFSLPISRNDKSSSMALNRNRNEKSSIREKLLSRGINSKHIFDDDDNDKNEKENIGINSNFNNKDNKELEEENIENENNSEINKMYNETNYWEMKNELPESIKKEVDKKTNIIFNYNPITGENEKKSEISEEDELLSIAMGLEQDEKMEKNKKIMYIMPGKLKPINLKTKSNPVQNIFINKSNNRKIKKIEKIKNKMKDVINLFNNDKNENEEQEEGIIKKEEDKNDDKNKEIKSANENKNSEEDEKDKMFNDVNYWKQSENYLNEAESKGLLDDL